MKFILILLLIVLVYSQCAVRSIYYPYSCVQCAAGYVLYSDTCYTCLSFCTSCTNGYCDKCITGYYGDQYQCSECSSKCIACNSYSDCTQCMDSAFISGGQCYSCSTTCKTCSGTQDTCLSCYDGYVLSGTVCIPCTLPCHYCKDYNYKCTDCISGYYFQNNYCWLCPYPCTLCSSASSCSTCADGFYLATTCLACSTNCVTCSSYSTCLTCLQGYYVDPSTHECLSCSTFDSNCYSCSKYNHCTSCAAGKYLENISNSGAFKSALCQNCASQCLTCSNSSTECLTCNNGYSPPTCINVCGSNQYLSGLNCLACDSQCSTCYDDANNCLNCSTNRVSPPECNCALGYFENQGVCLGCSQNCEYCSNELVCLRCASPYLIQNGVCISTCDQGYYLRNDFTCILCGIANCQECNKYGLCIQCATNYMFYKNQCYYQLCADGKYTVDNITCLNCDMNCQTCINENDNCSTCKTGSYWIDENSKGKCIQECPLHYYTDNISCMMCSDNCQECTNYSYCTSCISGQFLLSQQCYTTCPDHYYQIDQQCKQCPTNCVTCYEFYCYTCTAGYFIDNRKCIQNCDDGYYFSNDECLQCNKLCKTCTNGTECTSCTSPLYLENNTCLGTCPTSYFRDAIDNECYSCIEGCEICEDQVFCHKCLPDYAQFQRKCVNECDIGYYVEDQYCRECHIYCYTCNGPTIYDCVLCKNGLFEYQSMCVDTCPETTVQISGQCIQCYDSCQSCTNKGQGNCLTCKEDYIYLNNGCYAYCPSQYYKQNNQCLNCLSNCDICINSLSCIKCLTNYYYNGISCVTQCGVGYYGYDGICGRCHFSCKTCDGPLFDNCLSCQTSQVLYNGECLPGCPNLFYSTADTCSPCTNCDVCTASSLCTYCSYGKFLLQQRCVDTCNNGYMTNYVSRTCISCYQGCSTCYGQASNQCQTCFTGYNFYNNTCLSVCPSKTYNQLSNCIDCNSYCNTCDQTSLCLTCISNYYYLNEQCLSNCPEGYFKDVNKCTQCSSNCRYCTSVTVCTECYNHYTGDQDYFLQSSACVNTCPQYIDYTTFSCTDNLITMSVQGGLVIYCPTCTNCYFNMSLQKCILCDSSCLTCYGEYPGECLTCANLFQDYYCVSSCGYGYYQSGQYCLQCHKSCLTCQNNNHIDNCLTCNNIYLQLVGTYTGRCVYACDEHYLPDIENPVNGQIRCRECHFICQNCFSFNPGQCLSCFSAIRLQSGNCYAYCDIGYFLSSDEKECLPCKATCRTCDNPHTCLTALYYQQNGQQYQNCDGGYYASTNNVCQLCQTPCLRCSDATTCTACDSNYIFYNNYCVSKCANRYYYDSGSCYSCDSTCLTCFNSSSNSCLTCSSDRIYQVQKTGSQYYGYCVTSCPTNYSQDPLNNRCMPSTCDTTCLTCLANEPYFCLSCHDGYVMSPLQYSQGNLYYGYCLTSCSTGQYNLNGTCTACSYLCTQCSDGTNYCPSCISTAYRLNDQQCVMQCPLGYYANRNTMICVRCDWNCLECAAQYNIWISSTYYSVYVVCYVYTQSVCSSNQYQLDGYCKTCHWSCITCSGRTQYDCTSCGTIYYEGNMYNVEARFYYYGECVAQCPVGSVQSNTNCLYCAKTCETCSSTALSYCQSCYEGTYLLNGSCITDCGNNYYNNDLTQKCDPCYYGCLSCTGSGPYQCLDCKSGFYQSDNRCLPGCPYQYYFDSKLAKCIYCSGYILNNQCYDTCPLQYISKNQNCALCSNNCTSCNGLYLYQNQCVSSCNQGMYNNNGQCQNCDAQCQSCTGQADNCLVCANINSISPPKCDCLIGYQEDSSTCVQCHSKCHSCITYYNNCTECKPDRIQNPPSCTCPYGTYDNNGVSCIGCPFVCDDCLTASICLYCKGDRVGRTCLCRIGMYDDGVSEYCKKCDHTCTTCNLSGCLNCRGNRQMQNHVCSCPTGYFEDGESYNCPQCLFKCLTCDSSNCITCRGDRILPQCICSDGYYDDEVSDTCQQCQVECVTCTKASCLICKTNRAGSICDCPPGGVDRQDVGIMYCETCSIGTPIIQMQLDLITLIVKFGKQVTFDGECSFIDVDLLGIDPQCYVNDQYQIVIILGIDNKIKIGQEIQLYNIRALECDVVFPEILPTNILPPNVISSSDIIIFGPEQVNTCNEVTFYVGEYFFDARNGFEMVQWILNDPSNIKINAILSEANLLKNTTVIIPAFILEEGVTYSFTYQFLNYLGVQQSKSYSISCVSQSLPHIEIQNYYQQPLIYHLDNIIILKATITLQQCSDGSLSETVNTVFYKQIIKFQSKTVYESAYEVMTSNYVDIIVNPYTLSNAGYYQLFVIATYDKIDVAQKSIYLNMLSRGLYAQIYGGNQIHNFATSFKLTAALKDLDVASQDISTFSWICTNLTNNGDCSGILNQKSLIQQIGNNTLVPYNAYKFTVIGQKNGNSVTDSVIIQIVDQEIKTLLLDAPHLTLNNGIKFEQQLEFSVNEEADYLLGSLYYDYNLLTTIKIPYYQFSIALSQYLQIRYDQVVFKVSLNNGQPMPSVASITLKVLRPPLLCKLNVSPQQGIAYDTTFTIQVTGCIDEFNPILYKFIYYYNQTEYQQDIMQSLTLYSNLLKDYQLSNTYSTILPQSSISHSIVIVTVKNSRGAQLNLTCNIIVGNTSDDILLKQNTLEIEVKKEQLYNKFNRLLATSDIFNEALTLQQDERIALLNILAVGVSQSENSGLQFQLLNQLQADSRLPLITKATQTQIFKSISKLHNALIYSLSDYSTLLNTLSTNINDTITQFEYLTSLIQSVSDDLFEQRNLQFENLLVYLHSLNAIIKSLDNQYFNISQGNISLVSSLLGSQFNKSLDLLTTIKSGIFYAQFVNANPITYEGSAFYLFLNRITSQKLSEYLTKDLSTNEILNYSYTHYYTNPFILNPFFPDNNFFSTIQSIEPLLSNGSIIVPQQPITTKYLITKYRQTRLLQQYQDVYYLEYSPDVVHYSCINYLEFWQSNCVTSYEYLDNQLIVVCDCNTLGPTSISSLISDITIQEKFPNKPPIVTEISVLIFEYKKSVVMYSLIIFTAIFLLLLLYGFKKDQMERDRSMPEHLIESEYIRKVYEEKKQSESPPVAKTIFSDKLNDDIQEIAITPDIDPDEMLEEIRNNEDNSDVSVNNNSEEIDENTSKKLPKYTDLQAQNSPQPYQSLQGKDSLNNTVVKKATPPNNEEYNQVPVMKQPKKSIIKERQSSRQASEQFSIRQVDTLQQLIVNKQTEQHHEQPASPKINSMLHIDHQDELLSSEQVQKAKKYEEKLEVIEEDKKSLDEKEKIIQLWYLEQRRKELLQQGYQLTFTIRNIFYFITLFNQLMQIFTIFDKQLNRPLRFCLMYLTLLSTCTINLAAEVDLQAGSTIAYCFITALLSFAELLFLKFLLVNIYWLRMFGQIILLTLTAIYMYLIAHIMQTESENGEEIIRSNEWGVNFIICFFVTYLIIDPIFLIIAFLLFQWSFNTPAGKFKDLVIKFFMNNKHLNIYFDLLDQ